MLGSIVTLKEAWRMCPSGEIGACHCAVSSPGSILHPPLVTCPHSLDPSSYNQLLGPFFLSLISFRLQKRQAVLQALRAQSQAKPLRPNLRSHSPDQVPLLGEQWLTTCTHPRAHLCYEASRALPVPQPPTTLEFVHPKIRPVASGHRCPAVVPRSLKVTNLMRREDVRVTGPC